ncbi:hypothetical protein HWV62_43728 [Athelia sp. TMB]|nr:hypothetical protein HWV62_43728 [Athelia sp. TMB]
MVAKFLVPTEKRINIPTGAEKAKSIFPMSNDARYANLSFARRARKLNTEEVELRRAHVEELVRKISEMSQRIRELEDALALLHGGFSSEKHALLREDLLSIKNVAEMHRSAEREIIEDPLADPVDAFGTLTIGDSGESRYFGASAGSETLLSVVSEPEDNSPITEAMPELLNTLAATFPMGSQCSPRPETSKTAMAMLLSFLPPRYRASSLCESFLTQASWLFRPVQRDELIEDILTPVYTAKDELENPLCVALTEVSPHKLSTLYSIFALGALVDLTLPAFGEEDWDASGSRAMAYGHQDSSAAKSSVLGSLFGKHDACRPPAVLLSYVDCALPQMQSDASAEDQFWHWKYQLNKTIGSSIMEVTLGAKAPDYKTILDLDHRIREHPLPTALNVFLESHSEEEGLDIAMKGGYLAIVRAICLLYIHKSYFARALIDYPADPLRSPYSTSFLATFRCSSAVIRLSAEHMKGSPELCMRWWTLWAHLFSSSLVCGLIVTRAPSSSIAPAAFIELSFATELFASRAQFSRRVKAGMDILHRLRVKALMLLNRHRSGSPITLNVQDEENDIEELAIYSGQMGGRFGRAPSPRFPIAMDRAQSGANLSSAPPITPAVSKCSESQSTGPSSRPSSSSQPDNVGMQDPPPRLTDFSLLTSGEFTTESVSLDQPFSALQVPSIATNISTPFFSLSHLPAGATSGPSPSQILFNDFASQSLADPFPQLYAEMLAPGAEMAGIGETGAEMDGDWALFMKESGLI